MATRSTIALEYADGKVAQVYCHWDGYLEHNGQILMDHYRDPFKVERLIDLGDLSSLGPEVDPEPYREHNFDASQEGVSVFYGRDRKEDGCEARVFESYDHYVNRHDYEEYEYILRRDGEWYVSMHDRDRKTYFSLSELLAAEEHEDVE
jgi:hypothetical protein